MKTRITNEDFKFFFNDIIWNNSVKEYNTENDLPDSPGLAFIISGYLTTNKVPFDYNPTPVSGYCSFFINKIYISVFKKKIDFIKRTCKNTIMIQYSLTGDLKIIVI